MGYKVKVQIDIPKVCGECPFYKEQRYQCHNETGYEPSCSMGYMRGLDLRDQSYRTRKFPRCRLVEEHEVVL